MFDMSRPGRTYAREPVTGFAYSLYPIPGDQASLFAKSDAGEAGFRWRSGIAAFAVPPPSIPLDPTDPGTWEIGNPPNDQGFAFRRLVSPVPRR